MPVRFADASSETHRITLPEKTDQVWHGYLPEIRPDKSTATAFTVRTNPDGHRFNPRKVLLDPYAKAIARELRWDDAVLDPERDTAHCAPLARVVDTAFDWNGDKPLRTPWHETVVYELHVKGFTKQHPGVPEKLARHLRGSRLARGHRASARARRDRGRTAARCIITSTNISSSSAAA